MGHNFDKTDLVLSSRNVGVLPLLHCSARLLYKLPLLFPPRLLVLRLWLKFLLSKLLLCDLDDLDEFVTRLKSVLSQLSQMVSQSSNNLLFPTFREAKDNRLELLVPSAVFKCFLRYFSIISLFVCI